MKIIVDAMGGDNAPRSNVEGALQAVRDFGYEVTLVGRGDAILAELNAMGCSEPPAGVEVVHASEIVTMEDDPANAFRQKKDSSLTVGLNLLKEGKGDAFVSAGSTGALLSAATLLVKRIKGIRRAALAPRLPTPNGGSLLIDCGANAECTPEYLLQFAFMGSYYAEHIMGKPQPTVGLLNIGAEESKGTDFQRKTYALLCAAQEDGRLNFAGNVEGRDAMLGAVDVIVADGYTGNIFLKTMEGTALLLSGEMKKMFKKNLVTKLSAVMVSGGIRDFKRLLDYREVGGTPLLGICKSVVKAHGSSDAYAIQNAMAQAARFVSSGIIEDITEHIDDMRLNSKDVSGT